ncbi:PREDICTED: C-type lectin domain family 2 member A [Condylura cristata]|uniref:C-type lectin domain family 2 member A n=1 Tax=Condylura cristata TaxID=143302 RepID=UPI000642F06E|nr:PREDICTED: C-type lectin domain family 2 member A [Condylura cristata]
MKRERKKVQELRANKIMLIPLILTLSVVCSKEWIGVEEKCFYFSKDTRNWTSSKSFCSSHGSELAHLDTKEELEFLKKFAGPVRYWIGLSRKHREYWKWTDGITFNDLFEINGSGFFTFLNTDGVQSSRGLVDIKWVCSKPRFLTVQK